MQKCNSISNRIFSPCNLLFQISHHQVLLRFQPVKSKRRLETCVMVLVSFYEFLLVWPFHSKKKRPRSLTHLLSLLTSFFRVQQKLTQLNQLIKKKGSRRLIYNLCQKNSANIIIKTYEILQLKYIIQSQIIGFLLINLSNPFQFKKGTQ